MDQEEIQSFTEAFDATYKSILPKLNDSKIPVEYLNDVIRLISNLNYILLKAFPQTSFIVNLPDDYKQIAVIGLQLYRLKDHLSRKV